MTAPLRDHLRRIALLVGAIVIVNFLLPRMLPGSPMSSGAADSAVAFLPREAIAEIRRTYALDEPLPRQFRLYLFGLARLDLGRSLATHRPVTTMLRERLPWTLLLAGSAVALSAALGVTVGTLTVWRPDRVAPRAVAWCLLAVGALPEFLLAMALIVMGTWSRVVPVGGAVSPFLNVTDPVSAWRAAVDIAAHLALPAATLVLAFTPAMYLLSRNALSAVSKERYLMTARGKGLGGGRVLWHAWRNALPPVLTLLGVRFAFAVTGVAVVERIFGYPGVGLLLFEAVAGRDYPVIQGVFVVASATTIAVTTCLDLAVGVIDPRAGRERV